ncbi:MAG: hypothetical protein A2538_02450 [Candidatus Magasanikbacteria bacterium RIFOXYD2_FULL_41_14]|uniref:HD domain-containing protein n=1 Tax=Candidatus Magasanikbacteria bacterium RIFOXYD2_FULL_41_14 TaxID=1798709 RepID=A0A1F6PC35_9BACT|nr:MAG: hypothetical protein A2538_02450 [Candidatus Magasanikbacteria bacterium RIFOXYD2_FULL_41_14]
MSFESVKKVSAYVQRQLINEPTGHDWYHVKRVWVTAKRIQAIEGGDLELIELAALLHDLGDYKQLDFDEEKGILVLRGMMDVLEIPDDIQKKIVKIVEQSMFVGDDTISPSTLEGKIIQDADWMENLGAIGVARTFATGGRIKRVIHDPERKVRKRLPRSVYLHKKVDGTSFNFFYEKILKLPKLMNTETGRKIAEERVKFTKIFMDKFLSEWEGED